MRARSVFAVIAVVALVAAPAAGATAKKRPPPAKTYCNLLVDPSGDGTVVPGITSKGLDIIGGDLATGKKTMVAVLRLSDTDFSQSHDPWSTFEYAWSFAVSSSYGQSYSFSAKYNSGNLTYGAAVDNAPVTVTKFTVNHSNNTFTWVISRSVDKTLTRKNTIFRDFRGQSDVFGSNSSDSAPNNQATMKSTYPDLGHSCVAAS